MVEGKKTMSQDAHGDARRQDGDLVNGVEPFDSRTDPPREGFEPKVGWGHDAVYRPPKPDGATESDPTFDRGSPSQG